ncbi:hypothetical protein BASA81_004483 [Batrachochytrium salamandrivorans]|nr:hypothetical protein BASA81_004483 [Batrachochytrium salamandrivorans]
MASLKLTEGDFEIDPMRVHVLACKIHHTGPAQVDEFFKVAKLADRQQQEGQGEEEETDNEVLVATFRGRRMLGRSEKLPEGVFGLICREGGEGDDDDGNNNNLRQLQVESNFDAITYWKQDSLPRREEESVPVWLDFIRLARVLHS